MATFNRSSGIRITLRDNISLLETDSTTARHFIGTMPVPIAPQPGVSSRNTAHGVNSTASAKADGGARRRAQMPKGDTRSRASPNES